MAAKVSISFRKTKSNMKKYYFLIYSTKLDQALVVVAVDEM